MGRTRTRRRRTTPQPGEEHLLSGVEKLQGKDLSFNNLDDLDAARSLLAELTETGPPAAVIVKHANPCGAAAGEPLDGAYARPSPPTRSPRSAASWP